MLGNHGYSRGSALEHVGKRPMSLNKHNQRSSQRRTGSVRSNKADDSADNVSLGGNDPPHHHPLQDPGDPDDDGETEHDQRAKKEEEGEGKGRSAASEEHPAAAEEEESWTGRPLLKAKQWRQSRDWKMATAMQSRSKDKQSVLSALLPGAEIRDADHPVLVNTSTSNETVRFNIGGTMFETHRSTLHKLPNSPLADESFLKKHYQEDRQQYFFDRDPEVFGAILNYLRTGELHLPTKYCGPAVKSEIEFWGIEEDEIEECCWTNYSGWTTTLEALRKLEKDRKVHMPGSTDEFESSRKTTPSKYRMMQMKLWDMLNNPQSNIYGQVFSYVSLAFVILSIFSFVAQTHAFFRVDGKDDLSGLSTPPRTSSNSSAANGTGPTTNATDNINNNTTTTAAASTGSGSNPMHDEVHPVMIYIDAVCLAFFLVEFALRFALSPRKCKLLMLPMTIFEMLALLPDLIEFGIRIFHPGMRNMEAVNVITFLRLLRVFRIFRLMRHFPGLWILFYTLKASVKELLLLLMFLCVGMLFFASLIYYTDDREMFSSIPIACWWAIITMTTVGYGDMSPSTQWGYLVGSCTAICGVLVIGFTVPVLVNNFILYYQHTQCALNRDYAKKRREKLMNMRKEKEKESAGAGGSSPSKPGLVSSSSSLSGVKCNGQEDKMSKLREIYALGLKEEPATSKPALEMEERHGKKQHEKKNGSAHGQTPTVSTIADSSQVSVHL